MTALYDIYLEKFIQDFSGTSSIKYLTLYKGHLSFYVGKLKLMVVVILQAICA